MLITSKNKSFKARECFFLRCPHIYVSKLRVGGYKRMKDYIRKRVLDICQHILESKQTVRQTAIVFGVSKSTVHKDIPKVNGDHCI